jgi:hypothetical protein
LFIDLEQHLFPEVHVSLQAMTGVYWDHVDLRGNQFKQKEIDSGEKLGGAKLSENSGEQNT